MPTLGLEWMQWLEVSQRECTVVHVAASLLLSGMQISQADADVHRVRGKQCCFRESLSWVQLGLLKFQANTLIKTWCGTE